MDQCWPKAIDTVYLSASFLAVIILCHWAPLIWLMPFCDGQMCFYFLFISHPGYSFYFSFSSFLPSALRVIAEINIANMIFFTYLKCYCDSFIVRCLNSLCQNILSNVDLLSD